MSWYAVGAAVVSAVYSADQQEEAQEKAIQAQEEQGYRARMSAQRQQDQVRQDTMVARETGDMSMIAMGYMMGVRKPPSEKKINNLKQNIEKLKEEKKKVREDSAYWGGGHLSNEEYEARRDSLNRRIQAEKAELDKARMERDIAGQMGGKPGANGEVKPPDINELFEDVDLPTGDNIGSPDEYIPDLDNFLKGLGEDLENSRGYQFELEQGREALQNTLSKRGTSYGGNAIKEALQFSQDYASTKYGERHAQALQEYDREFQSGVTEYGMELDEYNRERQQALDEYGMNMDKYRLEKEQQDTRFGRFGTMAGYGRQGASLVSGAGQNYAQTVAQSGQNLASTIGQGAYSVAGARAQGASNIANTAITMKQYNDMLDRRYPEEG